MGFSAVFEAKTYVIFRHFDLFLYFKHKSNLSDIYFIYLHRLIMNPVIIGTIIWIIIGLAVGWKIINYVAERSPLGKEWENQKYNFSNLESP